MRNVMKSLFCALLVFAGPTFGQDVLQVKRPENIVGIKRTVVYGEKVFYHKYREYNFFFLAKDGVTLEEIYLRANTITGHQGLTDLSMLDKSFSRCVIPNFKIRIDAKKNEPISLEFLEYTVSTFGDGSWKTVILHLHSADEMK